MTFPRFLIAGAINTSSTYLLYLGLLLLMPYLWAYSLTYAAGIGLGYALNSRWVFKKAYNFRSATIYPAIYTINYFLGILLLWLFIEQIHISKEIAPLIVLTISVPIMYFMSKSIFQRQ